MSRTLEYRGKLAALWASQCLHFIANYGLRIVVVFHLASVWAGGRSGAFHLSSAIFMAPSIALVPLYGAISNSLPKRLTLIGSSLFCALVALGLAWLQDGWLAALGLVAVGSALYTPTRFAILPAAAIDTEWPLQRVLSVFETGSVLSMVAGMIACGAAYHATWESIGLPSMNWMTPPALALVAGAHCGCFVFCLPANFASDVHRPESPAAALRGFGVDVGRIWRAPTTRGSMLALAALRGIVTAATGAFVASALEAAGGETGGAFRTLMEVAVASILGAAAGSLLAGIGRSAETTLRHAPWAVAGMLAAIVWAASVPRTPLFVCLFVGACGGFVNVPLLTVYQRNLPADARGNGMSILNTAGFVCMTLLAGTFAASAHWGLTAEGQLWLVAGLLAIACVAAWAVRGKQPPIDS